ncbi:hypothetical protein NBT05_07260 [Aquimarina sp. ERC-38]|uniref:hypothetical protein n=1 Tax=Aquimarina sp. ERC-38 TaxID=2949996 RepID=UPI0022482671|nr:hypothetical protein [Aquimarina sp. ERC-38]UZO82266.1 hypothetical protein NBT05_07260 [Aquimarina sp. ERC-38]
MKNKILYRALLLVSFIGINAALLFGIGKTFAFLNSGADRSSMLRIQDKEVAAYMPKLIWKDTLNPGRTLDPQALSDIATDYVNSWYTKNKAQQLSDTLYIPAIG